MAKPMKGINERNGYWYAYLHGKEVYCGKGAAGKKTAEIARKKFEVNQHENRELKAGIKTKRIELRTVEQLVDWYLDLPSTKELESYGRKVIACRHIKNYLGKFSTAAIQGDLMEDYREHRLNQGIMDSTIDVEIQNLSRMFHLALKRKKISADAMPTEFLQKKETNPRRLITDEEYKLLLKHANLDFADMLICGWESAMRAGEIAGLVKNQIHLDETAIIDGQRVTLDYIYLGIFDTKTRAERIVPVSSALKEVLKRRIKGLEPEDRVFTLKGKTYRPDYISKKMEKCCERAGVLYGDKVLNDKGEKIGVVFHCTRHTRISKWITKGWSDEIVRKATGHKTFDSFRRYVRLDKHVVMRLVENTTKTQQNLSKVL